jgi:hypothetical protein
MSKLVEEQLAKVQIADLTNYNVESNTYFIPRKIGIKLEEDKTYIIKLKPNLFTNEILKINWNNNSVPPHEYLTIEVQKIMGKMVKITSVAYDINTKQPILKFWTGWLGFENFDVIQVL